MHKFVQESSFLLNQYSAACPASERYGAAAHMVYIRPALAGASNDQAGRTARSVPEGVENYFKNLTLVTWHNRAWVRPSIQMQTPPCFNGVSQSLTLPQNAMILRQKLCNLLKKGANESQRASWRAAFTAVILWCPKEMEDSDRC